MQLDRDRVVQEHDHVRCGVAVLLGLLDGDLAKRAEDVTEVGGQVVEHPCLDVRALDLGGGQVGPGLLLRETPLVEGDCDQEGLRVPVVWIAPMRVVQYLPADALEEGVALPGLLHGVLAVPAAADGTVDPVASFHVLEDDHLLVTQPVQEPLLMPAVSQMDTTIGQVRAKLLEVVAPLPVPVTAEMRLALRWLLRRPLIRGRGIRRITR